MFMLQGCIHKIVTVPVKVAYKTTKGVVKGEAAVKGFLYGALDSATSGLTSVIEPRISAKR